MGIGEGLWTGIQAGKARKQQGITNQLNQDQFELMEKKFAEDQLTNRLNNILSVNGTRTGRGGKYKGGMTTTSLQDDVTFTNLLQSVKRQLPEGSELAIKLANAPVADLEAVNTIIAAGRKKAQENGLTFTSDTAENLFENYYLTTVTKESTFNAQDFAEQAGINLEEDYVPGVTWEDYLKQYSEPTTAKAGTLIQREPVKAFSPSEQSALSALYRQRLEGPLFDMQNDFNQTKLDMTEQGQQMSSDQIARGLKIDKAIKDLSRKIPSARLATELVGAEVGINMLQENPRLVNFTSLINVGLVFTADAQGEQLLELAIKTRLLKAGDKFKVGSELMTIDQEFINSVIGG